MISYNLKCENEHEFSSWFKSSSDFDKLVHANLVECPVCGSHKIEKTLMAPNTSSQRENKQVNPLEIYRKQAKAQLKNAKNVGWQFASEARAIHNGDKKAEPIYGKTEPEDAKKLINEGVPILPLPFDPDIKEN